MRPARSRRYTRNTRNGSMLKGRLKKEGFELWRHFFWGIDKETQERRAFFAEYFIVNPELRKAHGPVLDKKGFSFAMARAGMLGPDGKVVAEFFKASATSSAKRVLSLRMGDNICLEDSLTGNLIYDDHAAGVRLGFCQGGAISWDLKVQKPLSYSSGAGASFFARSFNLAQMYWNAGGLNARFEGRITLDGREFAVEGGQSMGYQDREWGRAFSGAWLKIFGGGLTSAISGETHQPGAFMCFKHTPQLFGRQLGNKYSIILVYRNKLYDFSIMFDKNNYKFMEKEEDGELQWHIEAQNPSYKLVADLSAPIKNLTPTNYPKPRGGIFCLLSGGGVSGVVKLYKSAAFLNWETIDELNLENAGVEKDYNNARSSR